MLSAEARIGVSTLRFFARRTSFSMFTHALYLPFAWEEQFISLLILNPERYVRVRLSVEV